MTRHKHADVIHAFAEGETIQYKANGEWVDFCEVSRSPNFFTEGEYRIKPKLVKKEGWVALFNGDYCDDELPMAYGVYQSEASAKEFHPQADEYVFVTWEQEE